MKVKEVYHPVSESLVKKRNEKIIRYAVGIGLLMCFSLGSSVIIWKQRSAPSETLKLTVFNTSNSSPNESVEPVFVVENEVLPEVNILPQIQGDPAETDDSSDEDEAVMPGIFNTSDQMQAVDFFEAADNQVSSEMWEPAEMSASEVFESVEDRESSEIWAQIDPDSFEVPAQEATDLTSCEQAETNEPDLTADPVDPSSYAVYTEYPELSEDVEPFDTEVLQETCAVSEPFEQDDLELENDQDSFDEPEAVCEDFYDDDLESDDQDITVFDDQEEHIQSEDFQESAISLIEADEFESQDERTIPEMDYDEKELPPYFFLNRN